MQSVDFPDFGAELCFSRLVPQSCEIRALAIGLSEFQNYQEFNSAADLKALFAWYSMLFDNNLYFRCGY